MTPPPDSSFGPVPDGAWRVCGKVFRDGSGRKVFLNGVTYGPFKESDLDADRLNADCRRMTELGFNMVRIYEPPTRQMLAAASAHGLRLLCGVPWTQHVDFLADNTAAAEAIKRVRVEARRLARESSVAGIVIGNEIEKTLVRWMGPERVREFLEKLICAAKEEAPTVPVSYATYPSTEYLVPRNADFVCFNVFLEQPQAFAAYVGRLQNIAGDKPLVISEFGLDTGSHGEVAQAEAMTWQREALLRAGVAGHCWFSFTDEWHRGGEEVTDWDFGMVTRERVPKLACAKAPNLPTQLRPSKGIELPLVSVVVCTCNGASTLRQCLEALRHQSHEHYEVLVIDDGSTDATPGIASEFDFVHYHRQDHAGLSAARNLGMTLAKGSIIAYTDDDCMPDEDWVLHLALAYDDPQWVAAGGPNIPPPARNMMETLVAVAPGAPTHVLLNDIEAEHLPGCNLSIRKTALEAIGGFRSEFRAAGDDVDICWRLLAAGGKLRFVPGAVVWHHRRSTVRGYMSQQRGYGFAEALLIARFSDRFAWFGGARWNGAIYGNADRSDLRDIQFGRHGLAAFQCIYASGSGHPLASVAGLAWFACAMTLLILGALISSPILGLTAVIVIAVAMFTAWQEAGSRLAGMTNRSLKHQVALALLCWLQPIVRDWARLRGMIVFRAWPGAMGSRFWPRLPQALIRPRLNGVRLEFWSEQGVGREALLSAIQKQSSSGGVEWIEPPSHGQYDAILRSDGIDFGVTTVTEYHDCGRTLTRVRLGFFANVIIATGMALMGTSVILGRQFGWPDTLRLVMAVTLLVASAVVAIRHVRGFSRVRKLICEAADVCDLSTPGELQEYVLEGRSRGLAPSRERVEVFLEES